jgi:hypothetical protein
MPVPTDAVDGKFPPFPIATIPMSKWMEYADGPAAKLPTANEIGLSELMDEIEANADQPPALPQATEN